MVVSRRLSREHFSTFQLLITASVYAFATFLIQFEAGIPVWHAKSPIEMSTSFAASLGLAWTAILAANNWRQARLRIAWLTGLGAMGLLWLGEGADKLAGIIRVGPADYRLIILLWALAAVALFRCVRPYAMHRGVSFVLGLGLIAQIGAHCLWLYKSLLGGSAAAHPDLTLAVDSVELVAILTYVCALILTQISPLKHYDLVADHLGRKARQIFSDFRLFRVPRYPTPYRILHRAGFRHAVTLAMIIWYGTRLCVRVKRASNRGILQQYCDLFWLGYVEGIDPVTYYLLELYEPHGFDRARACLTRNETKNGLTAKINEQAPNRSSCPYQMTDKLEFWRVCQEYGLRSAPVLGTARHGAVDLLVHHSELDCDLFVKKQRGRGTQGTRTYRRVAAFTYLAPSGDLYNLDQLLDDWRQISANDEIVIQPRLTNASSIADLAGTSLITFRVVTCLDKCGRPWVTHGLCRILGKLESGWHTYIEYGAAIDIETGVLGSLTGDTPESCWIWFETQPHTHAPVVGRKLGAWSDIQKLALAAHEVFRGQILVGWDIALTEEGPILLEGNSNLDVSILQRCHRIPIGSTKLGSLLNDQLDIIVAASQEH